jgi:hypothetical protein
MLITRQVLGKLLGEILQEDGIVSLFGIVGNNRNQGIAHLFELNLGFRVEERKRSKIDGRVWIR